MSFMVIEVDDRLNFTGHEFSKLYLRKILGNDAELGNTESVRGLSLQCTGITAKISKNVLK